MPVTLDPSYFADGVTFDPEHLNNSLYSLTRGAGLYSELNGGIEGGNFDPSFELRQEHVQPEQFVKAKSDGATSTLDNLSDVSGRSVFQDEVEIPRRQGLPGCGVRVYVPFEATSIRWNIGWFWYTMKWFGLDLSDVDALTSEAQKIVTHLFVDGEEIPEMRREYPLTWFTKAAADYASATGVNDNEMPWSTEAEQANYFNLSYLQTEASVTNPDRRVVPGYHEAYLGFYVAPLEEAYFFRETMKPYDRGATPAEKVLQMYQRLSVGCRNTTVVANR
ncbi:MAG: hypothetical protein P1V36_00210 [Planctomycetota bacterium]|nr:hypothetical protein [Planctomycetota bacterium]